MPIKSFLYQGDWSEGFWNTAFGRFFRAPFIGWLLEGY